MVVASRSEHQPGPWEREFDSFVRAFSGAYLFGIPLLFTMEMWWLGTFIDPARMLAVLGVAFVANLGLVFASGFKQQARPILDQLDQVIDVLAVGIVGAVVVLLTLNRISLSDPLHSIAGSVVVQALPLSIGASLANAVFGRGEGREGKEGGRVTNPWVQLLKSMGATAIGAIFIGSSIAPTEEIPMLAVGMSYWHMLALIALSLVLAYGIVFASGFDPERHTPQARGMFRTPVTETAISYLVALLVSFGALLLLHQISLDDPLYSVIQETLVLGLPATIGGAAGRLAV